MEIMKLTYEEIKIDLIPLDTTDILTASGPFDGEDDNPDNW